MLKILLALFIFIPLLEIYVLLKVGGWLGAVPTILCILLTAIIGITLVRLQGLSTLFRLQSRLRVGEAPTEELFTAASLLLAGALLLTPGFVTDGIGFLLLTPAFRHFCQKKLLRHIRLQTSGVTHIHPPRENPDLRPPIEHDSEL